MKTPRTGGSTTAPATCPEYVKYRSGCKVCWKYYKTREDAELASQFARKEGREQASRGYDFGFCAPGAVEYVDPETYPNSEYAGLYEVCFP